jgi:hypothetical protein
MRKREIPLIWSVIRILARVLIGLAGAFLALFGGWMFAISSLDPVNWTALFFFSVFPVVCGLIGLAWSLEVVCIGLADAKPTSWWRPEWGDGLRKK